MEDIAGVNAMVLRKLFNAINCRNGNELKEMMLLWDGRVASGAHALPHEELCIIIRHQACSPAAPQPYYVQFDARPGLTRACASALRLT